MTSIKNLSCIADMTFHTLREGSVTERIVLGTALFAAGAFVAIKTIQFVSRFFWSSQRPVALPKHEVSEQERKDLEQRLKERYPLPIPLSSSQVPQNQNPDVSSKGSKLNNPIVQTQAQLLVSLSLNGVDLTGEMEVLLATALHAYHELKTEAGGDEDRFNFLAMSFLKSGELGLPLKLIWEEKSSRVENSCALQQRIC